VKELIAREFCTNVVFGIYSYPFAHDAKGYQWKYEWRYEWKELPVFVSFWMFIGSKARKASHAHQQ